MENVRERDRAQREQATETEKPKNTTSPKKSEREEDDDFRSERKWERESRAVRVLVVFVVVLSSEYTRAQG